MGDNGKLRNAEKYELYISLKKKILEHSLLDFIKFVFEEIYRKEFIQNWHHEIICKEAEDVYNEKTRLLIINIPPRYGKTEIVVICFIAWCYAKNPRCNFIHTSYSHSLALKNSAAVQNIITSEEFQEIWPLKIRKDAKAKNDWTNEEGGEMYASSSGGQITGRGAGKEGEGFQGALVIDDPMKAQSERFEAQLNAINENFDKVLSTRLNSKKTPVIIIMQRLHELDLSGYLLNGNSTLGKFKHICIKALKEDDIFEYDSRREGQALWQLKHDEEQLNKMKVVNPGFFAGQYQQMPAPMEGNIWKREWLVHYDELPEGIPFKVISCDMTFKESGSSMIVFSVYSRYKADIYLVDQSRGSWGFMDGVKNLIYLIGKHEDYDAILIEDKANGPATIDALSDKFPGVVPWKPTGTKEERLVSCLPMYQAGDIKYPRETVKPWIKEHIEELAVFNNGKYDDRVDAETQALLYMKGLSYGSFKDIV